MRDQKGTDHISPKHWYIKGHGQIWVEEDGVAESEVDLRTSMNSDSET